MVDLARDDLEPQLAANMDGAVDQDVRSFLNQFREPGEAPDGSALFRQPERGVVDTAIAAGKDVLKGARELPRALVKGTRDAVQETLDLTDELADFLETKFPLGKPQLFNEKGEFDPAIVPADDPTKTGIEIPDIAGPESTTGQVAESITQFLVGFAGAGKLPGVRSLGKLPITQAAVKGAIADFTVFDGHEGRLSNIIEEFPELQNPVTEFLAAQPGDSEIEGRLKNAVEGLGLGVAADGFVRGLRAIRSARKARNTLAGGVDDVTGVARFETSDEAFTRTIGDVSDTSEDIVTRFKKKVRRAEGVTETGVPDDVAAKGLTKAADVGGEEFFVNFARINTSDDVKQVIGQVADAFKLDLEKTRRGIRSNTETVASAQDIDAFRALMDRPTAQPLNAEQTFAVRELWASAAQKLQEVAETAATNPSNENLFAFRKMLATFHAIQAEVIAVRTETARALQQWRIPAGTGADRFANLEQTIEAFGGNTLNADFAARIARLGREGGSRAIAEGVDKGVLARSHDAVLEYWINGLLSGPKTHLVNTLSNTGVIGQVLLERAFAGRLGVLLGDQGVEVGEAMAAVHGIKSSFRDALRNAAKAFRENQSGFGIGKVEIAREPAIAATNFGLRNESFAGRAVDALGNIVRVPGRALMAEDEFFKTIGYNMELHAMAFRQATREARQGVIEQSAVKDRIFEILQDPPDNIKLSGVDAARYQTFTAKGSTLAQGLQRVLGKVPAGRYFLPFVNTPDNILRFTFERTPLAPLMKQFRDEIAAGGARQQMALSRLAIGTLYTMVAMDMAFNGLLTGDGPPDRAEKQTFTRAGWQRYSVRIGDRFFAYNRLDPVGFTLGLSADIAEYIENAQMDSSSGLEVGEVLAALAASIAGNITGKTYFTGLTDLVEAMAEPDRRAEAWVKRFAGSFVPVAAKEVERLIDPNLRATSNIVEQLKSVTPGLSQDLPQRVDVWGRPISYRSGIKPDAVGFVYDMVSPIYSREFKPEPIDQEMMNEGFFVAMPSKRLTIGRTTFNLRNAPDVYNRFIELRGNALKIPGNGNMGAKDFLNAVVSGKHRLSQAYANLPDAQAKEDFVKKVLRSYGELAKQQILQEFPQLRDQIELSGGRKREVILP